MRLVWKGKCDTISQIAESVLPQGAVRFKEPETPLALNLAACIFILPVLALVVGAMIAKSAIVPSYSFVGIGSLWGILLALAMVMPHELLHAVCFPRDAEAQIWYSPKNLIAFVYSPAPVTKGRFIFLSLFPSLIFGLLPLALWIFIPSQNARLSESVLAFAACGLFSGAGDYLNVYNAIVQMPRRTMTQLSGFHSYWFYPQA